MLAAPLSRRAVANPGIRWDDDCLIGPCPRRLIVMSPQEFGGPSPETPGRLDADEVVARLQELVDARPAESGYPLEWAVPAYFLGDMNALAVLSLRSED